LPEHMFTLVARGHSVDVQTNTLTLFSILEQISWPALPFRIPEFVVATLWSRKAEEDGVQFTQRTRFVDPDGAVIVDYQTPFVLERPRQRILNTFASIPFEKRGIHRIEICLRRHDVPDWGAAVTSYPLEVVVPDSPRDESLLPSDDTDSDSESVKN